MACDVYSSSSPQTLPLDAQSILELAARSMFHVFSSISQGMFLVDRSGRIVWVNEGYKRFLPALGFSSVDQFVGHMVEDVVPNTQMRRVLETGEPILIDLLTNRAGTFVVSRLPLRDEAEPMSVIGAIGIVLFDHPETTLQPLISKFAHLQRDLDDARRELASQRRTKYTLCQLRRRQPGGGGGQAPGAARRAVVQPGAAAGRNRHGQGTAGARDPRGLGARRRPASSASTSRPCPTPCWKRNSSASRRAPTPAPTARARDGKFKLADGGTLFLDEIGDMPLSLQPKLLRALQEGEIEPLGSNKVVRFRCPRDRRHLARPRGAGARRASFREDLYYRLNVLPIRVPPLRERRADIPALVEVLGGGHGAAQRRGAARTRRPMRMALLAAQHWRGNIRELRNVLEQAAMRSDSQRIEVAAPRAKCCAKPASSRSRRPSRRGAMPAGCRRQRGAAAAAGPAGRRTGAAGDRRRHWPSTGGNKLAARRLLGISRAELYERLECPD